MSTGRTDGRISSGMIEGQEAQSMLDSLSADLAELQRGTPYALDTRELLASMPALKEIVGCDIHFITDLIRQLKELAWEMRHQRLLIQIAHIKGDNQFLEKAKADKRRKKTLNELIDLFRKHRTRDWSPKIVTKFEAVSNVLVDILGGNTRLAAIDRNVVRELGDVLHELPPNYSKRKALAGLAARSAVKHARLLDLPRLGRKTVKDYYNHISALFEFAVREDLIDRNPMKGLSVYAEKSQSKHRPFSASELQYLFSAPIFVGCVDDEQGWRMPGKSKLKRGGYWVPLIALHTGMRLKEVCALRKTIIASPEIILKPNL